MNNIISNTVIPNPYPFNLTNGLSGPLFTITAIGGFDISQNFPMITLTSINPIQKYDLTQTVQIVIDVNVFNNKLGNYNFNTNTFTNDYIVLNYQEFAQDVSSINQIISVGSLSTLYNDFSNFVNNYFNYGSGLPSILSSGTPFTYNNNIFDASSLIYLIDLSGALSGSIRINNINQLLQYTIDSNIFGNRAPTGNILYNNGLISHGFQDGDLILISPSMNSSGIVANFNLTLDNTNLNLNSGNLYNYNIGPISSVQSDGQDVNSTATTTTYNANINNIKITRSAPLLLILKNFPYP